MTENNNKLPPIHPGRILAEEFMKPNNISVSDLAEGVRVLPYLIEGYVLERRIVTCEMALRFARYFGTTPEFWLNLQRHYDMQMVKDDREEMRDINAIVPLAEAHHDK